MSDNLVECKVVFEGIKYAKKISSDGVKNAVLYFNVPSSEIHNILNLVAAQHITISLQDYKDSSDQILAVAHADWRGLNFKRDKNAKVEIDARLEYLEDFSPENCSNLYEKDLRLIVNEVEPPEGYYV